MKFIMSGREWNTTFLSQNWMEKHDSITRGMSVFKKFKLEILCKFMPNETSFQVKWEIKKIPFEVFKLYSPFFVICLITKLKENKFHVDGYLIRKLWIESDVINKQILPTTDMRQW